MADFFPTFEKWVIDSSGDKEGKETRFSMLKSIGAKIEQMLVPYAEDCFVRVNTTNNIEPMLQIVLSQPEDKWSNGIQHNDPYHIRISVFVHGETVIPEPSITSREFKKIRKRKFTDGDKAAKYIGDYCVTVAETIKDAQS